MRWAISLLTIASFLSVRTVYSDQSEYPVKSHSVAYVKVVPTAIKRHAHRVCPTRFFGTFTQKGKKFAAHFYDTGKVRHSTSNDYYSSFVRDSRLDIFQMNRAKSWQRLMSYNIQRGTMERSDKIKIKLQLLWLDKQLKTIPLVHLQVTDKKQHVGNTTDVYGVLLDKPQPKHFMKFDGYLPYSPSTVYSSRISFPDSKGNLTLLFTESNPGYNSESAYGWTGKDWKQVARSQYNLDNSALYWNGINFVPVFRDSEKP